MEGEGAGFEMEVGDIQTQVQIECDSAVHRINERKSAFKGGSVAISMFQNSSHHIRSKSFVSDIVLATMIAIFSTSCLEFDPSFIDQPSGETDTDVFDSIGFNTQSGNSSTGDSGVRITASSNSDATTDSLPDDLGGTGTSSTEDGEFDMASTIGGTDFSADSEAETTESGETGGTTATTTLLGETGSDPSTTADTGVSLENEPTK